MRLLVLAVVAALLAAMTQTVWRQYQSSLALDEVPLPPLLRLPLPIKHYNPPAVAPAESYTILFAGDSMTAALGENFDELRLKLAAYFPNKVFGLFNYSQGSTSIRSLEEKLDNAVTLDGRTEPPILGRYYDLIIIESFGNNPLSDLPLEEGLKLQTEILDRVVAQLVYHKHDNLVVFLATIAPSKTLYGQGVVDLSPTDREKWASERIAYIQNHIKYAQDHNIPLINVYEKSLDASGNAELRYLNSQDYIHPSREGVVLISQAIADFLNTTLPH